MGKRVGGHRVVMDSSGAARKRQERKLKHHPNIEISNDKPTSVNPQLGYSHYHKQDMEITMAISTPLADKDGPNGSMYSLFVYLDIYQGKLHLIISAHFLGKWVFSRAIISAGKEKDIWWPCLTDGFLGSERVELFQLFPVLTDFIHLITSRQSVSDNMKCVFFSLHWFIAWVFFIHCLQSQYFNSDQRVSVIFCYQQEKLRCLFG